MILHRNLAVLRVAEARIWDELRAVIPLDDHIVGWVSPTEAVLNPGQIKTLMSQLESRGLAPLIKRRKE